MYDWPAVELALEPSLDSVGLARGEVGRFALGVVGQDAADVARLLVSELATNAVLYGGKPYTVRASWQAPLFRVEVIDGGPPPGIRARGPNQIGGWGLTLVEELSHEWGVSRHEADVAVWFTVAGLQT